MGGISGSLRPPHVSPSRLCLSRENKRFNVRLRYFSPASNGGCDAAGCEVPDVRMAAGSIKAAVETRDYTAAMTRLESRRWRCRGNEDRGRESERTRREKDTETRKGRIQGLSPGAILVLATSNSACGHISSCRERCSSLCCYIYEYAESGLVNVDSTYLH